MNVDINPAALKTIKWHEYAVRFLFGGLMTAATGIIAHRYGPAFAGLFLAFPVIFPASATLVESHERKKRENTGKAGVTRAREIASVDAAGAAMGTIGLGTFAVCVWKLLPQHSPPLVLAASALVWLSVSVLVWFLRKSLV